MFRLIVQGLAIVAVSGCQLSIVKLLKAVALEKGCHECFVIGRA